jgi:ABC-type transport system involved in multi-copper enzyme maturation permease subunit
VRLHKVCGKTLADAASPKLLAAYFLPFLTITGFLAFAMAENNFSEGAVPLATQEAELFAGFVMLAFVMAAGIPFLALTALLAATTLGHETERGTLQILLSKPVPRWEVFVGTFVAVVAYSVLVSLVSLLLSALLLFEFGDVSSAAIPEGVVAALPGHVAFAAFGASVVTAIGFALAVFTRNRLQTAVGALAVSALYFAFLPVRLFAGTRYEDYLLYLVDVNYHFGNALVFLHEAVGGQLPVEAQVELVVWAGVYEMPTDEPEALPASLDTVGLVPPEVSVALLAFVAVAALAVGVYRFEQMDL